MVEGFTPTQASVTVEEFTRDLTALSQRYGVVLDGEVYLRDMEPEDRAEAYGVILGRRLVRQ